MQYTLLTCEWDGGIKSEGVRSVQVPAHTTQTLMADNTLFIVRHFISIKQISIFHEINMEMHNTG